MKQGEKVSEEGSKKARNPGAAVSMGITAKIIQCDANVKNTP